MLHVLAALLLAGSLFQAPLGSCHGIRPPDPAIVVNPFAVTSRWSGHFGVDVGVDEGSAVVPAGPGQVSYSGVVVGNAAVTVDHGGGVRTSYSYLALRLARQGAIVGASTPVGRSGVHEGEPAYHFSVRVGDVYIDPLSLARCLTYPAPGLFLAPTAQS